MGAFQEFTQKKSLHEKRNNSSSFNRLIYTKAKQSQNLNKSLQNKLKTADDDDSKFEILGLMLDNNLMMMSYVLAATTQNKAIF